MEACQAVDSELDRVLVKLAAVKKLSSEGIDDCLATLGALRSELLTQNEQFGNPTVSPTVQLLLRQSLKTTRESVGRISAQHKDVHSSVSRLGKVIDKNFTLDFDVIKCKEAFEGEDKAQKLNQVVVEHLLRHGWLDVGRKLAEEAEFALDDAKIAPFVELNSIMQSLEAHDTGAALQWAVTHRAELTKRNSLLEYKLHRLNFIYLLKKNSDTKTILEYTRNFQYFKSAEQLKDIQKLMGALLFLQYGLDRSPYRDVVNQDLWADVRETFARDACALLGLSVESPLAVCIKMGCKAIPLLLTIRSAMVQHQVGEIWNCSKTELPIEIDTSPDYLYHSKFACPILRQQTSEKNPACRLNCGHAISREALNKLATSQKSTKIKCPYCPSEQHAAEAKVIYL